MRRPALEEVATITLGTTHLQYLLKRTKRRSVGLQITDQGLVVSAPEKLCHADLRAALQERQVWILSRLSYWRECQARMMALPNLLEKGMPVPISGQQHQIEYDPQRRASSVQANPPKVLLKMARPATADAWTKAAIEIEKLLKKQARARFTKVANWVGERRDFPPFTVHLSSAKHRWGSCNNKGELRLNWRLMFYPDPIIEYVVAHEMAHLHVMNHSPEFWAEVRSLVPDYEKAHRFLADLNPSKVPLL